MRLPRLASGVGLLLLVAPSVGRSAEPAVTVDVPDGPDGLSLASADVGREHAAGADPGGAAQGLAERRQVAVGTERGRPDAGRDGDDVLRRPCLVAEGEVEWLDGLPDGELAALGRRYDDLLAIEAATAEAVPADRIDSYCERVGYAARALALSGRLYVHEAKAARHGGGDGAAVASECMRQILADRHRYNNLAGGKWQHMMNTSPEGVAWPSDVPGGTRKPRPQPATGPPEPAAVTVLPAVAFAGDGPVSTYPFDLDFTGPAVVRLDLLPTMQVDPAGQLRLSVKVDDGIWVGVHPVPGGSSSDENGRRREGVQSNRVANDLPPVSLTRGHHTLRVTADVASGGWSRPLRAGARHLAAVRIMPAMMAVAVVGSYPMMPSMSSPTRPPLRSSRL